MKAFAICGSPNLVGNTSKSLIHLLDYLEKEGFETEYVHIYEDHMIPCNCCNTCLLSNQHAGGLIECKNLAVAYGYINIRLAQAYS